MESKMITRKATFDGYGSELRSALCDIEQGCTYWLINGVRHKAFGKMSEITAKLGQEFDLRFKMPAPGGRTLGYCKIVK